MHASGRACMAVPRDLHVLQNTALCFESPAGLAGSAEGDHCQSGGETGTV